MRMIHIVVIREKPPSKRPRKRSSSEVICKTKKSFLEIMDFSNVLTLL